MNSEPATRHQSPATHSDEVLVRVEGVSKKFCRSLKKSLWYGVCDIGAELNPFRRRVAEVAGSGSLVTGNGSKQDSSELATSNSPLVTPHGLRPDEFYAVRDVSFELRRGECLGLIGHNGAGKTTLLKMLNGLIKPDSGKITMRGRVARWSMQKTPQANGALIALGAGFNPILTGREPRPRMRGTEIDQPHVGPQGRASGVGESKYLHQWFGAGPFEKGTGAQMFYRLESLFFRILFAWEFKPVGG